MLESRISRAPIGRSLNADFRSRNGWLGRAFYRLLDWHERAQQRRHLSALSSYMLKDIGLSSADVYAELEKKPWQA